MRKENVALKFKNPPINELVIGVYFDPPLGPLQAEHVGVFWSQMRKEFSTITQQVEIAPPIIASGIQISFEAYPMPRYWLISKDEVMLLQIQKNAFLLNWRKREQKYPHFDEVKAHFDRHFDSFRAFMKSEFGIDDLPIRIAELTYTNLMLEGDVWTGIPDVGHILPGISVPDLGMAALQEPDINYVTAYRFASDLSVNFTVKTARNAMDLTKKALIFEFRSVGVLESSDRAGADDWYRRAHETIGQCFTAATSNDIRQSVWQPE